MPSRLTVHSFARTTKKRLRRAKKRVEKIEAQLVARWTQPLFIPSETIAQAIDPILWKEADDFASELEVEHRERFEHLRSTVRLGGGADYRLLYFITRLTRPEVAVETGVAAGWSSAAILSAMRKNGTGHLWSSELIYDRPWLYEDYGSLVGMVVDKSLHDRWTILLGGDAENLPTILQQVDGVDLFHYDSDKSNRGRKLAFQLINPRLHLGSVVIVDDINDNRHFAFLAHKSTRPYVVTGTRGTVGLGWAGLEGLNFDFASRQR